MSKEQYVFSISGVDLPTKVRLARTAKHMRQSDVAYLETEQLKRDDVHHLKINPPDVGYLEQGWKINPAKCMAILRVLGIEKEIDGTAYQGDKQAN